MANDRIDALVIFGRAGREDAGDPERAAGDFDCGAGSLVKLRCQTLAEQHILRVVRWPSAVR